VCEPQSGGTEPHDKQSPGLGGLKLFVHCHTVLMSLLVIFMLLIVAQGEDRM
jgi:hypothetical protein